MEQIQTKEDLYKIISNASLLGTLGMFVGSGFTKSILTNNINYSAYSWSELLEQCCDNMDIDKEIMKEKGSYPEIASKICKQYATNNENETYKDAVEKLKSEICKLTTVFPDTSTQEKYGKIFESLDFNWIVTTNYDTVLESVLGGSAFSIAPDSYFTKIKGLIPIYHIHGVRNNPNSIVITNEDYAYLFRPNDYRQARLPFLMKESLVLMIGYGLGDINVITAVDWAENVYKNTNEDYDFPIIQILYKECPKDKPYKDESGIIIQEINSIENFFSKVFDYHELHKTEHEKLVEKTNELISKFNSSCENDIMNFIEDTDNYRINTLDFVSSLSPEFGYIYSSYLVFLRNVISKLNEMSRPYDAFEAYDKKLIVLIDIFEKLPLKKMPPSFFNYLAVALDSVARYVGQEKGQSWDSKHTWDARKNCLPKDCIDELWSFAKSSQCNAYKDLIKLLKSI